jgi:hypothetical protein
MSDKWPGKELELPAVVAMPSFSTRTLFVEKDRIRADAIAAQQLRVLKKHYGGKLCGSPT